MSNLRKDREAIMSRSHGGADGTDPQRLRALQRENAQLHLKLKGLLSELEEIRAQREHLGLQSDSVSRLQSKQLAEHSASVKALEVCVMPALCTAVYHVKGEVDLYVHYTLHCHIVPTED